MILKWKMEDSLTGTEDSWDSIIPKRHKMKCESLMRISFPVGQREWLKDRNDMNSKARKYNEMMTLGMGGCTVFKYSRHTREEKKRRTSETRERNSCFQFKSNPFSVLLNFVSPWGWTYDILLQEINEFMFNSDSHYRGTTPHHSWDIEVWRARIQDSRFF